MQMNIDTGITLAKRDIFLNPDLVCTIINNYDYLSSKDRYCVKRLINRISQTKYLAPDRKSDILTQIKLHRKNYLRSMYQTDILSGSIQVSISFPQIHGPNIMGLMIYDYRFSVVWKTSDPKPIVKLANLSDFILQNNMNISDILTCGYIWNIQGCAGILKSDMINILIFRKDLDCFSIIKSKTGSRMYTHYKSGKIHHDNKPALVIYNSKIEKKWEKWYIDGNINRVLVYSEHKLISEHWIKDDKLHRDYGPAKILYDASGKVWCSKWYKEGVEIQSPIKKLLK